MKKLDSKKIAFVLFLVLWTFASVVTAQLVVGYLLIWILGADKLTLPAWSGTYSFVSYLVALALILFVPPRLFTQFVTKKAKKSQKKAEAPNASNTANASKTTVTAKLPSRRLLGLTGLPTWMDVGLGPVGFIVGTLIAVILAAVFSLFPWFDAEQAQQTGFTIYMNSGEKALAFIVLCVLAPVVEEIIFRGWLYGNLREKLKAPAAILITSLIFGILHFQWNVGVNVFALSIVLCGLREVTGTIYAGIFTHMIKNGVAFYLLYMV
ncbi:CPBP family intramembrane metalloprotease [Candidatus Saccharibacteria bacterium]|nr:CPBP family intramembrane metalloprotease [Candidatus Saccharibacteria bacterium]